MSGSVNKVILVGHVGRDPEIRSTQDGTKIANFTMATSERWRDKGSGEQRERSEWHRVCAFNDRIVKVVEQYVRKGSHIYVEGQLQTRKWTDQQGQERYTTEIVLQRFRGELTLLGSRTDGGNREDSPSEPTQSDYRRESGGGYGSGVVPQNDLDDEIPF